MRNVLLLTVSLLALSACTVFGSDKIDLTENKNVNEAIEAATGPLQDLNLRRQEIPQILINAAVNPYAHPKKVKCADVKTEIAALTELLGPDMEPRLLKMASSDGSLGDRIANIDDIELPESNSLMEGAGDLVKDKLMDTIRSQTDILPLRGIIRRITGASSHQKKLETAYEAGKLRRAYLKGLANDRFGAKCLAKPVVIEAKADVTAETATATH